MMNPDRTNLGGLIRNGRVLHTREALALVREVCDRPRVSGEPHLFPQRAEDLWLTKTGELQVELAEEANSTRDPRVAAAALLDALLPPASELPEFAVPPSLRS